MDAVQWDKRYAGREAVWSAQPNTLIVERLEPLLRDRCGRALDLACGEGRHAIWLARLGWNVTAIDYSSVAIAHGQEAAKRAGVNVDWRVGDVLDLSEPAASFDLVLVSFLHTPAPERARLLAAIQELLTSRGLFAYLAHDLENLAHGTGGPQSAEVLCAVRDVAAQLVNCDVLQCEVVARENLAAGAKSAEAESGHGGSPGIALDSWVLAQRHAR